MIPLQLTPEQTRQIRRGASEIQLSESQALSVRGKITAASGAGRKRTAERCPCGEMSVRRAASRRHICQ